MKEKVLITGASGFIGYHLIEAAISAGLDVHAAVRASSDVKHLPADITLTSLNYANESQLHQQLKNEEYNYIIHAAGITKAKTTQAYSTINAGYTLALAKAALQLPALKKFVFLSSLAAIGPLKQLNEKINQATTSNPVTAYGFSKRAAEQGLQSLTQLPWVIIRPTAVYGPREKDLFILFKTLKKGWDFYIGKEEQQLSFIHATDLAELTVNAAIQQNVVHKIYNISDGEVYSKYALADITNNWMNQKAKRIHLAYGLTKTMAWIMEQGGKITGKPPALNIEKLNELTATNWACCIQDAKTDLEWQPTYNLETGLPETLNWYKKNNWL